MQNPSPLPPSSLAVIIPAAGSGQRFGRQRNKLFAELAGKPLWVHAVLRLAARPEVGRILMAVSQQDLGSFQRTIQQESIQVELVLGGAERTDSVRAGIEALSGDDSVAWVAVHDAARPLVSDEDLTAVFTKAFQSDAAILATPVSGTVKRQRSDGANDRLETVDRRNLWIAQTPQVFRVGLLKDAYQKHNGRPATDDAELVERIGHPVSLVQGSASNIKITYPEDLALAELLLNRSG